MRATTKCDQSKFTAQSAAVKHLDHSNYHHRILTASYQQLSYSIAATKKPTLGPQAALLLHHTTRTAEAGTGCYMAHSVSATQRGTL